MPNNPEDTTNEDGFPIPKSADNFKLNTDGLPIGEKKNASSDGSQVSVNGAPNTSVSPSISPLPAIQQNPEVDHPILQSIQARVLQNKTVDVAGVGSGSAFAPGIVSNETIPDDNSVKQSNQIKEGLKAKGYDPEVLANDFSDIKPELINTPGFTEADLLKEKKDNPQLYERHLAAVKWRSNLTDAMQVAVGNGDLSQNDYNEIVHNEVLPREGENLDYNSRRQDVKNINGLIDTYVKDDGLKQRLKDNLATSVSASYGRPDIAGKDDAVSADVRSQFLDPSQMLYMHYLEDTNPDLAKGYSQVLVDPKKLEGDVNAKAGWEEKMSSLEQGGIELQQKAIKEQLNSLQNTFNTTGTLSPIDKEKATQLTLKQEELNQQNSDLASKYQQPFLDKMDQATQEIVGQRTSGLNWLASKTGAAIQNIGSGIWDFASKPFLSDESNKINQLAAAGSLSSENSTNYTTQENSLLKNFETKIQPELKAKIDPIMNNDALGYDEKYKAVASLLQSNPDKWAQVPIQDGKINATPSSLFYSVGGMAAQLAPFMASEYLTGGAASETLAPKLLSSFTSAAATGFHDAYAEAVANNEPSPFAHALRVTAINSAAMAGAQTPEAIRAMLGTKTAIGDLVSKMTDDEISGAIKENPSSLKNFGSSLVKSFGTAAKEGGKITAFTTAGDVLNKKLSGEKIDPEQVFKQALVNVLTFTAGGGVAGATSEAFNPTNLQKDAVVRAGQQPELFKEAAAAQFKNGDIKPEDYKNIVANIDKSALIQKKVPFVDNDGKPLNAKDRGDLMWLKMQDNDLDERMKKDNPETLQATLEKQKEGIGKKIDKIYGGAFTEPIAAPEAPAPEPVKDATTLLEEARKRKELGGYGFLPPEDALKGIAMQAQNILGDGTRDTGIPDEKAYKQTVRGVNGNEDLVKAAIAKYPAESLLKPKDATPEIEPVEKSAIVKPVSTDIKPTTDLRTLNYGDLKGQEETPEKKKEIDDAIVAGNVPLGGTGDTFDAFRDKGLVDFKKHIQEDPHNTVIVTHSSRLKLLKVWDDMGRPDELSDDQKKEFAEKYIKESTNKGEVMPVDGDKGKLFVVRHGETEDNQASEFRTNETQLTPKGEDQAENAGKEIGKQMDGKPSQIITSDLPRAVHTANIIHETLNEEQSDPVETTQDKKNQFIDDVNKHNNLRKNSSERAALANDLKQRAGELKIKLSKNGDFLTARNEKGSNLKKVNSTKNSTLATDYKLENYLPETHDFIKNTLNEDNYHNLPAIEGVDGKKMSMKQTEDAIKNLKEGKITHGAKAIYDAVDKVFKDDNVDYSDSRIGHVQDKAMDASEFVKQFDSKTPEASDDDIKSLHELMGDDAFEKYFNELKKQEDEFNNHQSTEDIGQDNSVQVSDKTTELDDKGEPKEDKASDVGKTDAVQKPVAKEPDNDIDGGQPKTAKPDVSSDAGDEQPSVSKSDLKKETEKINYARTNSYRYFKEKYPDIDIDEYNKLRARKLTPQEAGIIPFVKEFLEHDLSPRVDKFVGGAKEFLKAAVNVLSPKTGVSEKAISHIAGALGDRNESIQAIDKAIGGMEKMFNKMPDAERIAFIDRLKRGEPQPTKELQIISDTIKALDKQLYDAIKEFKPSLAWKEDHFRVLWKKIPGTEKEKLWSNLLRRPLRGSMGFVKQATLADMTEGIERGGEPQSTNPITMFKLAYADGMKYITAQRMFDALKKDKMIQFVKTGKQAPDEFVPLNDRMAKVYFKTPEGLVNTGEYHIEEGAGRLLNNHLSRDYIRETKTGKGLMALKNLYTQIELGLSAFHAVAEGLETVSSTLGLGLRKLINLGLAKGDPKMAMKGIGDIVSAVYSPKSTFSMGRDAIRFASEKDFETSKFGQAFLKKVPDAQQYIHDLFQGGGILKQNDEWKANTFKALKENAGKDNYIGAAIRALPAFNESIMSPLFNHYIPALKVGMFMKEFPVALAENQARIDAGKTTRAEVARKTVNFIDDRLGEMNFDNLYWNRTFKTAMQFFTRSVTWKLGNLRAMGGAIPEQARDIYDAYQEKRAPILQPKLAWLLGLSAMQVALASVIQHTAAHKDLESFKDLVAPQINPDDPKERVVLPTYYKDILHASHDPGGYLTSSASGVLGKMTDVWNNKDFYGYEIHDIHDSKAGQLEDNLKYMLPKPFSISSAIQMHDKGEPVSKMAMSFFGLNKAPGYLNNTDIENEIFDLNKIRNAGIKPKSEEEAAQTKRDIRSLYKSGDREGAQQATNDALQKGTLRNSQARYIFTHSRGDKTAAQIVFSELPFEDKQYLFGKMTAEEKKEYDPKGSLARQIKLLKK